MRHTIRSSRNWKIHWLAVVAMLVLVPVGTALAAEVGANDFRISQNAGTSLTDTADPAVAYNATANEYLVVWRGLETGSQSEIYGQRIDAATGAEVGTSDFQISSNGTGSFAAATEPAVAYNSTNNQYLVVWVADQTTAYEYDVYGQLLNADGSASGTNFRISDMSVANGTTAPAVAYNATNNEYLVVWSGYDTLGGSGDAEIYGQRLTNAGAETGSDDFRISDMGADTDTWVRGAFYPAVAYNSAANEYLVVWEGDDTDTSFTHTPEIYGQRLTNAGVEAGTNDFQISDMGANGDSYDALRPDVAYDSTNNLYLAVWSGEDTGTNDEYEIYGQRLTGAGVETGTNDFQISAVGPAGNASYDANTPAVTYLPGGGRFFVTWSAEDDDGSLADDEHEIYGQPLDSSGLLGGVTRLSDMGSDGDTSYNAFTPDAAYGTTAGQVLTVWQGDDNSPGNDDGEIFGQRFGLTPTAISLVSFSATTAGGNILLEWETASELDNLGFNLYRSESADGQRLQLNATLIPAQNPGSPAGATYSFADQTAQPGVTYTYWLEDVDVYGATTLHGPVSAELNPLRRLLPARPRLAPSPPELRSR